MSFTNPSSETMQATPLKLKSGEELRFVGEGNEHIVFALSDSDCVLRFRKFPREDRIRREDFMLQVTDDLSFINDVARPLAGPLLVDEARLVSVDPCLLEKVMERIKPLRDEKRLFKIINSFGVGILTPNVVTEFISRRSNLKICPKILNLSINSDVITVHSSLLPFCNKLNGIITATTTVTSCSSSDRSGSSISSPNTVEESFSDESQNTSSLVSHQSFNEESQTQVKESPSKSGVETLFTHCTSKTEAEKEEEEEEEEVAKTATGTPKREEESQSGTNSEELGKEFDRDFSETKELPPSHGHVLCIELKPKQGYLEPGPRGSALCRFCLKQYLKVEMKTEESRSSYCPGDLFSGDTSLMIKALNSLFAAPQNNLKIFSDGKRITDLNRYRHLSELIILILTHETSEISAKLDESSHTSDTIKDEFRTPHSEFLPPLKCPSSLSPLSSSLEEGRSVDKDQQSTVLAPFNKSGISSSFTGDSDPKMYPESRCHKSEEKSQGATPKQWREIHPISGKEEIKETVSQDLPVLPQGSLLSPSSFLGKILYLQSLGRVGEVEAALLYREMTRRMPSEEALHKRLVDFEFLKIDGRVNASRLSETKERTEITIDSNRLSTHTSSLKATEEFKGTLSDLESSMICQLLQQCLVTMSAKDASLMMLIQGPHQRCDSNHSETSSINSPFWLEFPSQSGKWYKCQVSLVDVALKSPQTILEHARTFEKLEEILTELRAEGREPPCCKSRKRKKDEAGTRAEAHKLSTPDKIPAQRVARTKGINSESVLESGVTYNVDGKRGE